MQFLGVPTFGNGSSCSTLVWSGIFFCLKNQNMKQGSQNSLNLYYI